MDAQALQAVPTHLELRELARELGLKNSFLGCNQLTLEAIVALRQQGYRTPAVMSTKTSHQADQAMQYQGLLGQVSVAQLGEAFPRKEWDAFMESGWAAMPMPTSTLEARFLHACTLCSMADMGVTPTRGDTYLNCENHAGYDCSNGWLRKPATTPNAAFVATHPTTYRLTAGLLARQLLRAGALHTEAPRAHRVHCLCGAAVALRSNPTSRARACVRRVARQHYHFAGVCGALPAGVQLKDCTPEPRRPSVYSHGWRSCGGGVRCNSRATVRSDD